MARARCGRCDSTSQGHQWASSRLCVSGSVGLAGHLLWSRPRRARMRGQTVAHVTGPFPASSDLLGVRAVRARAGGLCAVGWGAGGPERVECSHAVHDDLSSLSENGVLFHLASVDFDKI